MTGNDKRFDEPKQGLLKQEFTSYETKDGTLYKKTITRIFGEPSTKDYLDSYESTPIASNYE
jgi:hypothetical protein